MDLTPEEIDEFEALMAASSLGTPDGTDPESVPSAVREELHAVATALFSPGEDAEPVVDNTGPATPEATVLETALGRLASRTACHADGADRGLLVPRSFDLLAGLRDGDPRRMLTSSVDRGKTIILLIDGNSRTLTLALYEPKVWRASSAIHSFIRSAVGGIDADTRDGRWDLVRKYLTAAESQAGCRIRLDRDSLSTWRSTLPPTDLSPVEQFFNDRRHDWRGCSLSVGLAHTAWHHPSPPVHLSIPQVREITRTRPALLSIVDWPLPSTDGRCGALTLRCNPQESYGRLWVPDRTRTSLGQPADSWNVLRSEIHRWPISRIEPTTLSSLLKVPLSSIVECSHAITDWDPPFGERLRPFSDGRFCAGFALATSRSTTHRFHPLHLGLDLDPSGPWRSLPPDDGDTSTLLAEGRTWSPPGVTIRRDMDGQIIVESDVEARLFGIAGKLGNPASVPTRLIYRTSDPYAMEMHFQQSNQGDVSWYFARELLNDALRDGQSGLGDVRFRKDEAADSPPRRGILMQLSSGDATAELVFQSREMTAFIGASAAVVPIGSESVHTDRAFKELESTVLNARTSR